MENGVSRARVRHLFQNQSDHYPLLIASNGFAPISTLKRPFQFQVVWLSHDKFRDGLKESWKNQVPLYPLLHQVDEALDEWNIETSTESKLCKMFKVIGSGMTKEKDNLWSRVACAKYCNGRCDIDMFSSKSEASNVWQGISKNAKLIRKGARAEVGNRRRTLFWSHSWAYDEPLSKLATKVIPPAIEDASMEELWDENEGWKWHLFEELLPEETLKKITVISVNPNELEDDCLIWNPTGNGVCTFKSVLSFNRQEIRPSAQAYSTALRLVTGSHPDMIK
ncbi:hypothetical protein Cgig2_021305 [Carnegiea gigantea]|uniref:Uncharacterized protein n=1 Tax=Carnegiea gigantea TaxID=171969 RepID=A0A9Q1JMT7_9CARY|nr:hypothetical protein Cgig2_021305 [Carnegiea gigantea]